MTFLSQLLVLAIYQTEARRKLGFENMKEQSVHVEEWILEAKEIHSIVSYLAATSYAG